MLLRAVQERLKRLPETVKTRLKDAWAADRKSFLLAGIAAAAMGISLVMYLQLRETRPGPRVYLVPADYGILSMDTAVPDDSPLAAGIRAWQQGYPYRAVEALRNVLPKISQRSLRAHICNYLGHIHLYLKKYNTAALWYRNALREEADNPGAGYGLGVVAWYTRQYQLARRELLAAHRLDKRFIQPLFYLGQVYTALRDPRRAADSYLKLLSVRNIPLVRYLAGTALLESGNIKEGTAQLQMAGDTSSDPVIQAFREARLGDAAAAAGKQGAALAAYRRVLELYPRRSEFQFNYGVLLLRNGKLDEAVGVFQRLVASGGDQQPLLARTLGEIHYDRRRYTRAIGWMQQAAAAKGNPEIIAVLGDLYYLKKDYENALRCYDKVYAAQPRTELARLALVNAANIRVLQQKFNKARELYRLALRDYAPDGAVMFNLGLSYFRQKEWEKAAAWFRRSFRQDSQNYKALAAAADALISSGDYRSAMNVYRNVLSVDRVLPAAVYAAAGRVGLRGGVYSEAVNYYRTAVRLAAPGDPVADWLENLGRIYILTARYADAHRVLARARTEDPGSAVNRLLYGILLLKESRYGEAEQTFRDGLTMKGSLRLTAEFYYRLGTMEYRKKNYSAALALFKRALDLDPKHLRASGDAAQCVDRLGSQPQQ